MSWQNLEELMTELLILDKGQTVPGSGNGKGEEDVIGLSTITQCKYSDKKNMSILRKDMDRLQDAAYLQDKLPLFITEHNGELLLTLPNSLIFKDTLNYIIGMSLIRHVELSISSNLDMDVETKNGYIKLMYDRGLPILDALNKKYKDLSFELETILNDECRPYQTTMELET